MESGFLAALTSATFAVASGGVAALLTTGLIRLKLPLLWSYEVSKAIASRRDLEPKAPEESVASGST
jgi:hypothetical protein